MTMIVNKDSAPRFMTIVTRGNQKVCALMP